MNAWPQSGIVKSMPLMSTKGMRIFRRGLSGGDDKEALANLNQ
jgi:hypothetical protein